jgi:hypothetical protein
LPIPEQNTGIAFINDLLANWETNNTNNNNNKQAFECLKRNFEQLRDILGVEANNQVEDVFLPRFGRNANDEMKLGELNREFESWIRLEIKDKQLEEKIKLDRSFFMRISILWILFVSL